ncbi:MAG: histidine phosphatase domain-containing protein [Hyperionvirus sp.]|uniref:Histidine phosphatase domain-containing protein n=1 Tax=Hyperionvirus sp. TaxID=2487770 RepID=A0A3G5AER5_9VIRU|nr:MAG: histidine phosphatase domain-containing protein [Hyperionvirus sp.]
MELLRVIVVARHGARSPILGLEKLEKWKVGTDVEFVLTGVGGRMCYDFGKRVGEVYGGLCERGSSVVLSTDTSRTIDSAKYFAKGLWGEGFEMEPIIDKRIFGDVRLTEDEVRIYKEHRGSIVLGEAGGDLDQMIWECFGFRVQNVWEYFDVYSTLQCYLREGMSLPVEWKDEYMLRLERLSCCYYNRLYENERLQAMFTDDLVQYIEEFIEKEGVTLVYMSTHDSVVFPLALRLKGTDVKIADFCSSVKFEVWDHCVRVYYDDVFLMERERVVGEKFILG